MSMRGAALLRPRMLRFARAQRWGPRYRSSELIAPAAGKRGKDCFANSQTDRSRQTGRMPLRRMAARTLQKKERACCLLYADGKPFRPFLMVCSLYCGSRRRMRCLIDRRRLFHLAALVQHQGAVEKQHILILKRNQTAQHRAGNIANVEHDDLGIVVSQ